MAPKPIIVFDTVPKVRVNGKFKLGCLAYFNDGLGGLSGVQLLATDGTSSYTQHNNINSLRTQFFDVGAISGGVYSTYSGYENPNFYYSGHPIPAWAYEFTLDTSAFAGSSPYIWVYATAKANNTIYENRTISGFFVKDSLVSKPIKWVDSVNGVDSTGRGTEALPYKSVGAVMGYAAQEYSQALENIQIYLKSGDHDYIGNPAMGWPYSQYSCPSGWVDIQPAPGVAREHVVFNTSAAGWTPSTNSSQHLHFRNVTFSGISPYAAIANNQQTHIWMDNCVVKGGETFASTNANTLCSNVNYMYNTNTKYINVQDGLGWTHLSRDSIIQNYIQSAFRMVGEGYPINGNKTERVVLNCQAIHQDALGTEAHPDVIHLDFLDPNGTYAENCVVQGCRAYDIANSQGIFAGADSPQHKDLAFISVLIPSGNSRMYGGGDHILMRNCQFPSGTWLWNPGYLYSGPVSHWANSEFTNNIFHNMGMESGDSSLLMDAFDNTWSGNMWTHNAFQLDTAFVSGLGTSYRYGLIEYNEPLSGDYRAFPMLGNSIFGIGYRPSGWNNIGTEIMTQYQAEPFVWAYNGAFAPFYPDIGAWLHAATDSRVFNASLSADCILSPGGCQRASTPGKPIRGSNATRTFINILRPSNMTRQQYEQMFNEFLMQLINTLISTRR